MGDYKGAALMLPALPKAKELLADKGHDADWLRTALAKRGVAVCIRSKSNRKVAIPYDATLDKRRHKIENMSGRLKDWRRIGTSFVRNAATATVPAASLIFGSSAASAQTRPIFPCLRGCRLFRYSWAPDWLGLEPFGMTREASPQTHGCFIPIVGRYCGRPMAGFTGLRSQRWRMGSIRGDSSRKLEVNRNSRLYIVGEKKHMFSRTERRPSWLTRYDERLIRRPIRISSNAKHATVLRKRNCQIAGAWPTFR